MEDLQLISTFHTSTESVLYSAFLALISYAIFKLAVRFNPVLSDQRIVTHRTHPGCYVIPFHPHSVVFCLVLLYPSLCTHSCLWEEEVLWEKMCKWISPLLFKGWHEYIVRSDKKPNHNISMTSDRNPLESSYDLSWPGTKWIKNVIKSV